MASGERERERKREHSKPTSWYKFAKRNTGLIVRPVDAGCIQIDSLLKRLPSQHGSVANVQ